MTRPTLNELIGVYLEAAAIERLKNGKPGELTVRNTLAGIKHYRDWLAHNPELAPPADDELSIFAAKPLRKYLASMVTGGIRPISALSFVNQLRQLFAKWVLAYYEDQGWTIPAFPYFRSDIKAPRYRRPAPELIARVKDWYHSMNCDMTWYAATMMLEFAVRNGDVRRLVRGNFVEVNGRSFLNYTPNKTARSSGRMVRWPIHPTIWQALAKLQPWNRRVTSAHFTRLNNAMRELGFVGTKGAYELRKICIDHVYQKFGAEMAVSISGDDIKTITRYYADPAQPNIGDLRVSELL